MAGIALPPIFVEDVDVPLSSSDLNALRTIAIQLDGLTNRRMNVTNSSGPQTTGDAADWHSKGDYRQSWWGFRNRSGMTDLVIKGACATQIDIYINNVLNSSQAASVGFTKTINLVPYAFQDGENVRVEIKTNGNPNPASGTTGYTGKYIIWEIYATPIVVATTWPGVPTFAGTYDEARLNQLRDAAQYIWDRVNAVPIVPNNAMIYAPATHKVETIRLFNGGVGRYASSDVLRVAGFVYCQNTTEHYEIDVNGSTVVTSSNFGFGQTVTFSHDIALSHTIGTRVEVAIRAEVTDDTISAAVPYYKSYYTLTHMRSQASYTTATPPTAFTAGESISASTLNTRLNAIATMLSDAYTRVNGLPELWNRVQLTRRVYAKDATQVSRNVKRHASVFERQGDILYVHGKGVKIGYGAITVKPPGENEQINYSDFTFAVEQTIGTEDKYATHTVVLDSLPGLRPGMLYYVWAAPPGSIEYAVETLG